MECSELREKGYGWHSREQFYKMVLLAESKTNLDGSKLLDFDYLKYILVRESPVDNTDYKFAVAKNLKPLDVDILRTHVKT